MNNKEHKSPWWTNQYPLDNNEYIAVHPESELGNPNFASTLGWEFVGNTYKYNLMIYRKKKSSDNKKLTFFDNLKTAICWISVGVILHFVLNDIILK